MYSQIYKFRKLVLLGTWRLAILRTFVYIRGRVYNKLNISAFIQSELLIGGPATPLHALYVVISRCLFEEEKENVMNKDWDNLILLDSYRADYFREYSSLSGELSTITSEGTWSLEFIVNNFQGSDFHDTVVVTSNPYYEKYSKLDQRSFHSIIYCPRTDGIKSFEKLSKKAVEVNKEFPNKRLIIHYMKPHTPHISETSDRLRNKFGDLYPGIFWLYRSGVISKDTLEQSYIETINNIEPYVQTVLEELNGKSVVSADHGENLGEIYYGLTEVGHGNPTQECYRVPWLEVDYTERKRIISDSPVGPASIDEEIIEENLRALGYI